MIPIPVCIPSLIFGLIAGALVAIAIRAACNSAMCEDYRPHDWTKWETSPGGQFEQRRCAKCGWKQRA